MNAVCFGKSEYTSTVDLSQFGQQAAPHCSPFKKEEKMETIEKYRLLALDFDFDTQRIIQGFLQDSGVKVTFAGLTHPPAKVFFKHFPFDIIVMEICCHDCPVMETIRAARELFPEIEIILLSRSADEHMWNEALNHGVFDLMQTPPERKEFLRTLFTALGPKKRSFNVSQEVFAQERLVSDAS
jgi:DNA-binding NtrC family response regulator